MTREELRKKINKYTKEQIIEGIFNTYFSENEIKKILNSIDHHVKQKRIEDDFKECERVTNNSNKAIDDYVNYVKQLKQKYGDNLTIGTLTKDEFNKLYEVTDKYEKTNKEYYDFLERDIERYK